MNSDFSAPPTKSLRAWCFSPLVMFLTYGFEFAAALYILWRYEWDRTTLIITALLINLGAFQVAEWQVCANDGAQFWGRLGFVATALLIPLGAELVQAIAPSRVARWLANAAWILAAIFIGCFFFVPGAVEIIFCGGNYTLFQISDYIWIPYTIYYFGFLFMSVSIVVWTSLWTKHHKVSSALRWLAAGYLSFLIPSLTIYTLDPATRRGLPSIMCGFAVLLAITLVGKVAPLTLKRRP